MNGRGWASSSGRRENFDAAYIPFLLCITAPLLCVTVLLLCVTVLCDVAVAGCGMVQDDGSCRLGAWVRKRKLGCVFERARMHPGEIQS